MPAFDIGVCSPSLLPLAFDLYVLAAFPEIGVICGLLTPSVNPGLVIIHSVDSMASLSPHGAFLFS